MPTGDLCDFAEATWNDVMTVNVKSMYLMYKAVIAHMLTRGGGTIINTSSVMATLTEPGYEAYTTGPPIGIVRMLEHVRQHADFYRVMLGAQGDPAFVAGIRRYSEQRLRSLLPNDATPLKPGSPPLDLCLSYIAHAGIGALIWWLQAEQLHPPEQIAAWLNQLNKETLEYVLHMS